MLDRTNGYSTETLTELVQRLLTKRSILRPVGYDDDLTEAGLSSLDTVNLMLSVEAEFAMRIPESEMTPSNFRSIARIDALLQRLVNQSTHA